MASPPPPTTPPPAGETAADRELRLKEAAFLLEWEKLQDSRKSGRQLWSSPVLLTVVGALLGLIATGVANLLETRSAASLERQKFESGLIGKAFETGDQEQAAKYLSFLATTRVIRDEELNERLAALATRPGDIPVFDAGRGALELNARRSTTPREVTELIITDAQVPSALMAIAALQSRGRTGGSYHYLVDSSGVVVPLIPEEWEALHTTGRNANSISIGLAHVSRGVRMPWPYVPYSPRQIAAVTRLVADVAARHRIPPERIIPKSQIDPSKASDVPQILPQLREAAVARAREAPAAEKDSAQ